MALLLTILAVGSMFYGNLIALMQKDFKRLLGFSGIAHAGYALIGFVALDQVGLLGRHLLHHRLPADGAGLLRGHLQSSRDGTNVAHRRTGRPAPPRPACWP